MNFLIYYGIGLVFTTGIALYLAMFTTYWNDKGIEPWSKELWVDLIIDILLLSLVWPVLIITNIVSVLYYIIKNKKG